MRKSVTLMFILLLASGLASANSSELFSINEANLSAQLSELNELEAYLSYNDVTLAEMQNMDHALASGLNSGTAWHNVLALSEPPLGISSFLWGFCLGLPGLAIVYFVAEDPAETKKALIGCVVSSLIYGVFYVVWYAAWWGTI